MLKVSEHTRAEYGIAAATATAMLHYGFVLLAIAGGDEEVGNAQLDWLIKHQRRFGAPDEVIDQYLDFDHRSADIVSLVRDIATDVPTWAAAPHLIYHAIQMCTVDGTYDIGVQRKVTRAARRLGVTDDIILTIQTLIDMEKAAAKMRRALFGVDTL
ncbi:hypothetical protein AB0I28_34410 [Phytomonospora sp. NPDC050363]|uniref:hypothetical protein n=1 Tax=Phytomonospora sp. NPDC050363 TaxID=3155642 RepID=UPI003402F01A